ncbi:hypothetical protein ANTQUA_LOCUS340 [Anthophora quadrimaculata]
MTRGTFRNSQGQRSRLSPRKLEGNAYPPVRLDPGADSVYDDYLKNFEGCVRNNDNDDEIIRCKRKTMQLNTNSSESEQSENEDVWTKKNRTINLETLFTRVKIEVQTRKWLVLEECTYLSNRHSFLQHAFSNLQQHQEDVARFFTEEPRKFYFYHANRGNVDSLFSIRLNRPCFVIQLDEDVDRETLLLFL